jgi:hypothetical protein
MLPGLLDQTARFVRRLVVVGDDELVAIALWNAHTYVVDCGRASPYLHAFSPEPGSGKTTLLDVLELTARNPVQADGLSEAVLFRMLSAMRPTLLLDEVDAIFGKRNSDSTEGIRQVLNSGYRKGKQVWRCVPPAHDVAGFDVYGAKALAGLHELPGTLAHRAIPIAMKPPLQTDTYEEFDAEDLEAETELLRANLESWADDSADVLCDPRLKPPRLPSLDARGNEIWRILLRIADHAGGEWPDKARNAAIALSGRDRQQHDSRGVRLLADIRDVFPDERMSCHAICDALNADDALPYGDWNNGAGITTRELGRKLRPYGIKAKTVRSGEQRGNGYERDQFEDAWNRYLHTETVTTVTTVYPSQRQAENKPGQHASVTVSENGANPHGCADVTVVTVSDTESGSEDTKPLVIVGDPLYPVKLAEAQRAGHITLTEARDLHRIHVAVAASLAKDLAA